MTAREKPSILQCEFCPPSEVEVATEVGHCFCAFYRAAPIGEDAAALLLVGEACHSDLGTASVASTGPGLLPSNL